ncbi:MmgE/PrpD family protein [Microvirga sp. KLBC 81]|uniref:MmgE/PrpD family protein n=1 Tax=Microvirga sp. KLBC 81 TaxID=1862707 RepID=UPI000D50C30A|nr:MmgE/PrpD family protein [Microvirga sp. KLBC 81]PVE22189.1 MmgE/PrpD family protein [Microvirga sp. KLBC 81]
MKAHIDQVDQPERERSAVAFSTLVAWAAEAVRTPVPEPVRRRAALILADDLGAMVAGAAEPQVAAARTVLARTSRVPEATVYAKDAPRLDRYSAAAANGMAATWCELDEGFRGVPCHAGAYALPAILAEAEACSAPVESVLASLAVAYEVTTRIARAFPFATLTVHPHAAFAAIGAAAGGALIRKTDAETLLAAVSGAASMSFAGPYNHAIEGALVRNAWTSAGSWIGLRSVDWAEAGIGGMAETPYDVFVGAFGTGWAPDALTERLGEHWAVAGGYHKIFACCQYAHSAIEATLDLHARLAASGRRSADILEIVVETHPHGLTLATVEPRTTLAAKFSMPHAVAASAVLGTGGQKAFSDATLSDPEIAALRRRVRLVPHPEIGAWPKDRPARISWRFSDGETWAAACDSARGGADQPFDQATLFEKLSETTGDTFPRMAETLAAIVACEPDALRRPWRALVAEMLQGDAS